MQKVDTKQAYYGRQQSFHTQVLAIRGSEDNKYVLTTHYFFQLMYFPLYLLTIRLLTLRSNKIVCIQKKQHSNFKNRRWLYKKN